jgi:hypothetical protein
MATFGILSPTALVIVDERNDRVAAGIAERKAAAQVIIIASAKHLMSLT